jgi:hypothetical protein
VRNRDASTDRDLQIAGIMARAALRSALVSGRWKTEGESRVAAAQLIRRKKEMADNGSSTASTGIIAILVIFVILVVGALFVFGGRWFGGNKRVDVNIGTPAK